MLRNALIALALLLALGASPSTAQTATAQTATGQTATAQTATAPAPGAALDEPVAVPADAPPGSSQEVAIGSGIGAGIGIVLIVLMLSSL